MLSLLLTLNKPDKTVTIEIGKRHTGRYLQFKVCSKRNDLVFFEFLFQYPFHSDQYIGRLNLYIVALLTAYYILENIFIF